MRTHRSARSTLLGFVVTLTALLALVFVSPRGAWSFSADVPSPVLASITGGGAPEEETPVAADGTKSNVSNPAAPSPDQTAAQPQATSTAQSPDETTSPQASRGGSKWPAIILGVVVALGVVLVGIYFYTRERDD